MDTIHDQRQGAISGVTWCKGEVRLCKREEEGLGAGLKDTFA